VKIYEDLKQNTPEWLAVRLGKFTASDAQAIGNSGPGLMTLCFEKAAEILTGKIAEGYTNADMERGHELEEMARNSYELLTGVQVKQVGFIEADEMVGCSPDGLIKEDGIQEIKCKNDVNFARFLFEKKIDPAHEWQMQMQLLVSGRQYVDYVLFNPNFNDRSTVVTKIARDEIMIKKLEAGLAKGKEQLAAILAEIKK
jgi:hypothetical protein